MWTEAERTWNETCSSQSDPVWCGSHTATPSSKSHTEPPKTEWSVRDQDKRFTDPVRTGKTVVDWGEWEKSPGETKIWCPSEVNFNLRILLVMLIFFVIVWHNRKSLCAQQIDRSWKMVIESSSNCLNKDALSQALQPIVIKIKGSHIFFYHW